MALFAMPSAAPLGAKLVVAMLMLWLVGILVRTLRGGPLWEPSVWMAIVVTAIAVVALEACLPRQRAGGGHHELGILAAVAGALCGGFFLRPQRPMDCTRPWRESIRLAAIALIAGLTLGLLLGALSALGPTTVSGDRMPTFGAIMAVCAIAGAIGAAMVAVAVFAGRCARSAPASHEDEPK